MMEKHINPFASHLVVPYIEYVTKVGQFDMTSGDLPVYGFEVEAAQHCRVYTSKAIREFMFRFLSSYAREMFMALQYFVNPEYQYVILSFDKMSELMGPNVKLSKRRYEDTVRELLRNSVIDIKDRKANSFWYNPNFFCAGNRLEMFEECKEKVGKRYAKDKQLRR